MLRVPTFGTDMKGDNVNRSYGRTAPFVLTALVVLMLAACGRTDTPVDTETWSGVATSGGVERTVTLEVERRGDRLTGEYRVNDVPGTFEGELDGTALTAELRPSADCSYALTGTLSDSLLEATYEPLDCPDGSEGVWRLNRS